MLDRSPRRMLKKGKEREFVAPEALSWCISDTTLSAWTIGGMVLTKAHIPKMAMDKWGRWYHYPLCGARVEHHEYQHVLAPQGWPQCKHCSRKTQPSIPKAFEDTVLGIFRREKGTPEVGGSIPPASTASPQTGVPT